MTRNSQRNLNPLLSLQARHQPAEREEFSKSKMIWSTSKTTHTWSKRCHQERLEESRLGEAKSMSNRSSQHSQEREWDLMMSRTSLICSRNRWQFLRSLKFSSISPQRDTSSNLCQRSPLRRVNHRFLSALSGRSISDSMKPPRKTQPLDRLTLTLWRSSKSASLRWTRTESWWWMARTSSKPPTEEKNNNCVQNSNRFHIYKKYSRF